MIEIIDIKHKNTTITSMDLVELINKFREMEIGLTGEERRGTKELTHDNFMKRITKEVKILKENDLFSLVGIYESEYKNDRGRVYPCYELTRDGALQMLNSESTLVRYKTIEYINKLEKSLDKATSMLTEEQKLQLEIFNAKSSEDIRTASADLDLYRRNQIQEIDEALQVQTKITESKHSYVNQGQFGAMFNLKIGSRMVGKLLKIVGIAQRGSRKTIPYETSIPRLANSYISQTAGVPCYSWNYNECVKVIDKWLKDKGYYESFYSCEDKLERNELINSMYEVYVDKI